MGRARKKKAPSIFVLFTPKWTKIEVDSNKFEQQLALMNFSFTGVAADAKATLQALRSRAIVKPSLLSQVIDADKNISNSEFVAKSEGGSKAVFDFNNADDLISSLMVIETDENQTKIIKKSQTCRINAQKQEKLAHEIFVYIHIAWCQRLFSLK